jgi:phage gp29-like protein
VKATRVKKVTPRKIRARGDTRPPVNGRGLEFANAMAASMLRTGRGSSVTGDLAREMKMRMRISPLRGFDFESFTRQRDAFNRGWLGEFAQTMEAVEQSDDVLKSVAPKRKKAASRNGYEILRVQGDDSPEAKAHEEALKFFYANCRVTNALDENERGGLKLLLRQMMDAVGKKYAVHEIVWKPVDGGVMQEAAGGAPTATGAAPVLPRKYTAEFRFVPLQFFENTAGRLRFLPTGFGIEGEDLKPGQWLVTVGDGVMVACALAWLFKNLPLKDWAIYCQRHGMPIIKGSTTAQRGSVEWSAMEDAVAAVASEMAVVMSNGEGIEAIDIKGAGELPYPAFVERSDRALARLWRGGDLGTMSKDGHAAGSNPQQEEMETLEEDDAEMLTEALQQYVDRYVIEYTFGPGVTPLAYIQVNARNRQNIDQDLQVAQFLLSAGAPMGVVSTMERLNWQMPDKGEDLLEPIQALTGDNGGNGESGKSKKTKLGNARLANVLEQDHATLLLIENARPLLAEATSEELAPLAERIEQVLAIENEEHALQAVRALRADLPLLTRQIARNPKAAQVFYQVFGAALLNGYATAAALRQLPAVNDQ